MLSALCVVSLILGQNEPPVFSFETPSATSRQNSVFRMENDFVYFTDQSLVGPIVEMRTDGTAARAARSRSCALRQRRLYSWPRRGDRK